MKEPLNWNRSALILAGLLFGLKLSLWAVATYVANAELAAVLSDGLYAVAMAGGVVANTRKPKP